MRDGDSLRLDKNSRLISFGNRKKVMSLTAIKVAATVMSQSVAPKMLIQMNGVPMLNSTRFHQILL
jgi:hypothetical protein